MFWFSKILFNAVKCGAVGTPCDDGDPFTTDDKMDASCNCVGEDLAINDCAENMLDLGTTSLSEDNYSATQQVQSGNTLTGGRAISFVAGESIIIMAGFTVGGEATLEASIEDCIQNIVSEEMERAYKARKKKRLENKPAILMLDQSKPDEVEIKKAYREVIYRLEGPSDVTMDLVDESGNIVIPMVNRHHENRGTYKKYVPKARLKGMNLSVRMNINGQVITTPITAEPAHVKQ